MSSANFPALTDHFRDFYVAVDGLRRQLAAGGWPPAAPSENGWPATSDAARLALAQAPLLACIATFADVARRDPALDADTAHRARQLMAVFADRVFTRLPWDGRDAWCEAGLERQLFATTDGRAAVFARIDALLATGQPGERDLGRTYLMALCLGPWDDPHDPGDASGPDGYRERLAAFVLPRGARGAAGPRDLTPQAYVQTQGQSRGARLPAVRRWALVAAAAILLAGAVSRSNWHESTQSVASATARIVGSP